MELPSTTANRSLVGRLHYLFSNVLIQNMKRNKLWTGMLVLLVLGSTFWLGRSTGRNKTANIATPGSDGSANSGKSHLLLSQKVIETSSATSLTENFSPNKTKQSRSILVALNRKGLTKTSVRVLAGEKISNSFAEVFELVPAEKLALEALIAQQQRVLREHAATFAKVAHHDNIRLEITIPPFDGAADSYEAVDAAFRKVLGDSRYDDFKVLSENQLLNEFASFGAETRNLLVERGPNNGPKFVLTDTGGGPLSAAYKNIVLFSDAKSNSVPEYNWINKFEHLLQRLEPSSNNANTGLYRGNSVKIVR